MTAGLYPRYLQTALDDTLGLNGKERQFEMVDPTTKEYREGTIRRTSDGGCLMDVSGGAIDLSRCSKQDLHRLWVRAISVFSKAKDKKITQLITLFELLAIWDYAGKIKYKGMLETHVWSLLHARLLSPPAKMLTNSMTFGICQQLIEKLMPTRIQVFGPAKVNAVRMTPGLLKTKGIQRAKLALPDDAGIELSYWALPGETPEQAKARVLLRNFAHQWWVYNLEREAHEWLRANGNHPDDKEVIDGCIRRAAGSDYWDWHRGSRLFFWRFPEESGWRKDARDGVEFWHLADPPKGMHFQNIPASSREAELQLRTKVFQLSFRWYLEKGPPDLITPRFPVEKVVDDDRKVLDIRGVWDAKWNGLNATLWSPGFALPTVQDGADFADKLLTVSVGEYLRAESPPQNYDQDLFVKSFSWDHHVAQHFNNYRMHKKERHSHGVRFIHTRNDGGPEPQTMLVTVLCSELWVLVFSIYCNTRARADNGVV
eukprot:scaffold43790_cov38-Cyclotella_meneghiniana.AAC.3